MSDENGFYFEEVREFQEACVNMATHDFPQITKKFMKAEAKKLKKHMVDKAKSTVGKVTGNYYKGFKAGKKVYPYSDAEYNVRAYNSSPHAHLIEHGHRMTDHQGNSIRWVDGYHIIEDSGKEFETEFERDINEDLSRRLLEELTSYD